MIFLLAIIFGWIIFGLLIWSVIAGGEYQERQERTEILNKLELDVEL